MATKYIVDNLSGQTITGNLIINGNLTVTGSTNTEVLTYKGLLTQTEPIVGAMNVSWFDGLFIIGETYTIQTYQSGDDFSNIANVVSGIINQAGCIFIATGQTPTNWDNGSTLDSSGNLAVTVLTNNLGFDVTWTQNPNGVSAGLYVASNELGFIYNTFPRNNTSIITQLTTNGQSPSVIQMVTGPLSYSDLNDSVFLNVWNFDSGTSDANKLYYTPVQIDLIPQGDNSNLIYQGVVNSSYPFSYVSISISCNGVEVDRLFGDSTTVTDITELITQLNNNPETSFLGVYSDEGGGNVRLTTTNRLKNQFCSSGTFSFYVFSD